MLDLYVEIWGRHCLFQSDIFRLVATGLPDVEEFFPTCHYHSPIK